MSAFHLQIVSMDGLIYDGNVQKIMLRTIDGDVAILNRHTNYCTAVAMGTAHVLTEDGKDRSAACIGGMLSMMDNECRLIPTTWEWSDEIDVERAESAKKRAEETLAKSGLDKVAVARAQAKLYRALVRIGTAKQ
ncbi:MAG: ATP synthase F1 subunit epsilon [Lachnospiraceae bacterium]|nr:ATP synthase F1 subunit epsilon [Lachnospiraceae bacterium]